MFAWLLFCGFYALQHFVQELITNRILPLSSVLSSTGCFEAHDMYEPSKRKERSTLAVRPCALRKEPHNDSHRLRACFVEDIKMMRGRHHPNVVAVYTLDACRFLGR
eukprot:1146205-Pelagomonas_calceolata.AAC.6